MAESSKKLVSELEAQLQSLDHKLEAETRTNAVTASGEEQPLTPEQAARHAKQRFGDALPENYLGGEEFKIYERMYGAPIRILKPGEEEAFDVEEESEAQEGVDEQGNVGTGVLKEGKDGQLQEVAFLEDELESEDDIVAEEEEDDALAEGEESDPQRNLPADFGGLDQQTLSDLNALGVEEGKQTAGDESDAIFQRTHPLTIANRFGTPSSTVQLPKSTFVDPVSLLISGLPAKHVSESAHRLFGGPGLPYSTATPKRGLTMPQKAIPLDPYQGRMSEMEADVYTATIMPAVYATAYSIMIETRKRLGSSWLEALLNKEGGPRILDAGGAGAGVLAAREVLRAEWERMHDTSDDPDATFDLAEAGGKTGGSSIPAPVGRATVLTASDQLRQRASTLLDDTTFLPRLPDYLHASDEQAKERGKFDIIFAPHTLWQMKEDYLRKAHVANLWSLLSTNGGVLILFEKGVPRGFEIVAAAREMLLDKRIATPGSDEIDMAADDIYDSITGERWEHEGPAKERGMIIAPCTNHYECPMYRKGSGVSKGRKDHCHFTQRYIRPPFLQKLLGAKDRNHEDVDFSYLSVMRGRDLRDKTSEGITQGDRATDAAFTGYEHSDVDVDSANSPTEKPFANESDPTAPAIPDLDDVYGGLTDADGNPHSLSLPRAVMPPMKRHGHVILDVCTPSGTLERWTVPRSFSKQAYRDARKASWGDLWALGAKTRVRRNVRIGQDRDETSSSADPKGALTVKGKSRKTKEGKAPKNTIEVGYDAEGNIKEEDMKVKNGGRMRQGNVKGIRDKRDKKGLGNGRRKGILGGDE